jgi:hypothetical protein
MSTPDTPHGRGEPESVVVRLVVAVYVATVLAGAFMGPVPTMVVVAAASAFLMRTAWVAAWAALTEHPPSPESVRLVTSGTFGLPFYLHGTYGLGDVGTVGSVVLLMAAVAFVQLRQRQLGSL